MESTPLQFHDFSGDYAALSQLMTASWNQNQGQGLDYSPEFLRSYLQYPGMTPALAPVILDNGRPIAFVCAFPRTLRIAGQTRRFALLTLFTVSPACKGRGLGVKIWVECLRRAREAGFEGTLHYCVDGNVSNHVITTAARQAGYTTQPVLSVPYLMAYIGNQPGDPLPEVDAAQAAAALVDHAERLSSRLPIARLWSPQEALWQCRDRFGALAYFDPASGALLSGYVVSSTDEARTPCLFLDEVHWAGLASEQRGPFLKTFLRSASQRARLATVPLLGYVDPADLKAAGFRRSPRLLHTYLTLWTSEAAPVDSLYADVL
ncbi:MAG TPA: GNAT family N-acetyltransferase [Armatimonadota bacterium]|jgi:GNAT superfamily N-acetyltransferase